MLFGCARKKLEKAVQGWAALPSNRNETLNEMRLLGAPEDAIREFSQTDVIEVLPMNWDVVVWFNQVCNLFLWRFDGQCLGFDLCQIESEANMSKREYTRKQYLDLCFMGRVAAKAFNGTSG